MNLVVTKLVTGRKSFYLSWLLYLNHIKELNVYKAGILRKVCRKLQQCSPEFSASNRL